MPNMGAIMPVIGMASKTQDSDQAAAYSAPLGMLDRLNKSSSAPFRAGTHALGPGIIRLQFARELRRATPGRSPVGAGARGRR